MTQKESHKHEKENQKHEKTRLFSFKTLPSAFLYSAFVRYFSYSADPRDHYSDGRNCIMLHFLQSHILSYKKKRVNDLLSQNNRLKRVSQNMLDKTGFQLNA